MLLPFLGLSAVGVVVGILSGLCGVGGGILMVPAILHFWPTAEKDVQHAIATSLAAMVPISFAGAFRHAMNGYVDYRIAVGLAGGAILGTIFIGAPLAHYLPAPVLKKIFGVVIIVFGLQMTGVFELFARK